MLIACGFAMYTYNSIIQLFFQTDRLTIHSIEVEKSLIWDYRKFARDSVFISKVWIWIQ